MSGAGHGTGYEDAITRKIAAAENMAQANLERLGRAQATIEDLTRDNASLRLRTRDAEERAKRMGGYVVLAALIALGVLGAATWFVVAGPGR